MAKRNIIRLAGTVRIVIALFVALALLSAVAATLATENDQFLGSREPKMALPTLTCVAPNCMPTWKSALIPIERI